MEMNITADQLREERHKLVLGLFGGIADFGFRIAGFVMLLAALKYLSEKSGGWLLNGAYFALDGTFIVYLAVCWLNVRNSRIFKSDLPSRPWPPNVRGLALFFG